MLLEKRCGNVLVYGYMGLAHSFFLVSGVFFSFPLVGGGRVFSLNFFSTIVGVSILSTLSFRFWFFFLVAWTGRGRNLPRGFVLEYI